MRITDDTLKQGYGIAIAMSGNIGGSVIPDRDNAKDVDIFVGASAFRLWLLLIDSWPKNMSGYPKTFSYMGHNFNSFASEFAYTQADIHDALALTYRSTCGLFNIIVVHDDFVPAFKASVLEMAARPERYKERNQRISLHHRKREMIRNMLAEPVYLGLQDLP